jgi:hypothetical protein
MLCSIIFCCLSVLQGNIVQYHHWREGNLPPNSKCVSCKKTCWSSECLAGMRCEWCGVTVSCPESESNGTGGWFVYMYKKCDKKVHNSIKEHLNVK